jgi:hypothetical protein
LGVWFGLPNLNKLALGDMARQNFQVKAHCLRFSSALIFGWLVLEDDLGRTSRLGHIIEGFLWFGMVWQFGLVCKT